MNIKPFYLSIVLFVTSQSFAQNFLSSLIDTETNFPKEMKKAKAVISANTEYLIYNFIPSRGGAYSQYQFEIRAKNDLILNLPHTDNFEIAFFDYKTKLPVKTHTFYVEYAFPFLKSNQEFLLNKDLFSPQSYFKLEIERGQYSNYDIVQRILNVILKVHPYDNRYELFLNKINAVHPFENKITTSELFGENENELTMFEKAELLSDYCSNELDEEFLNIVFQAFINDKENQHVFTNLNLLFGVDFIESVDEYLQQKVTINTNRSAKLIAPSKYLAVSKPDEAFIITVIECKLDYKNKTLTIDMKGEGRKEITLKNVNLISNKIIIPELKVSTDMIQLVISETKTEMFVEDKSSRKMYVTELKGK